MGGNAIGARSLEKRTAIVTGGASGIGRAVALAYAREGARVVVSDIDEEGGAETVELIEEAAVGAEAVFVRADASTPDDHEALAEAAVERFGVQGAYFPVDGGYLAR